MFPSARTVAGACWRGVVVFVACMPAALPSRAVADFDAPITATWNGIGLRDWAGRLTGTTGVPVLVDRRLDPDTAISLECHAEPLGDVVERAATLAGGELATLRSVLWIVPPGRAAVLARAEAARETRVAAFPPRQRAILLARRPLSWPAGSRPLDLLTAVSAEAGVTVEGLETVPHDHLAALELPAMTLAERLDLLLAAFDLRVEWQDPAGGRMAATPRGTISVITAGLPAAVAAGKQSPPKLQRRPVPAAPKTGEQHRTFSLQVAAPLDELLATITPRLGLELDLDRSSLERAGIAPAEIVRAGVKDASRDELLDAILGPLGLTWTITGDTLQVRAPDR